MKAWAFIKEHKLFAFFFVAAFVANLLLPFLKKSDSSDFVSCSTYDSGPLGSSDIYQHLQEIQAKPRRLELGLYRQLNVKADKGKTLLIFSPIYPPAEWEWEIIFNWVVAGNRLITGNLSGTHFLSTEELKVHPQRLPMDSVRVMLPTDTAFSREQKLPYDSAFGYSIFLNRLFRPKDSIFMSIFQDSSPSMMPLLQIGYKTIAAKRAVGNGEWVLFSLPNPLSNNLLKNRLWYDFMGKLLLRDGRYANGTIWFDEYHNGVRATKSFWGLLCYYRFDQGIWFIGFLLIAYLFFSGIRILTPQPRDVGASKDILPGMKMIGGAFLRHKALDQLLTNDFRQIREALLGGRKGPLSHDMLAREYLTKHPLPPQIKTETELAGCFVKSEIGFDALDRREQLKILNTFATIRKELRI